MKDEGSANLGHSGASASIADGPIASVVIPAHNEGAVIGRLLESLPKEIEGRTLEIIVSCNGCTDDTAAVARGYGTKVVEIKTPSKIAALNAADEVATAFPRLYIDGDVVITAKAVADLIRSLSEPGILSAAPPYRLELAGRPWSVRAYFAVWLRVMSMRVGYLGSGVYAVSKEGRGRFGQFPNVVADDTYVRNHFAMSERRIVPTDPTIVQAPWTLRALLRRRVRVAVGNLEMRARPPGSKAQGEVERMIPWWWAVLTKPRLIPASAVYVACNGYAFFAARKQFRSKRAIDWARDNTTRSRPLESGK